MKPSKAIVEAAKKNAALSQARFKVGAVVYYKGQIIGKGYNKATKTHTLSPHPFKFIDAEFSAVIDAVVYAKGNLKHCGIYIHRLKKDSSPGLAKPCEFCSQMLSWIGIKESDISYSVG
jgi:cytidine deaminase